MYAAQDIRGQATLARQIHRFAAEAVLLAIPHEQPRSPQVIRDEPNGGIPGSPAAVGVAVPWHRGRDRPAIAMGVVRQHLLYIQMKQMKGRRAQRPGTQRRGRHKLAPFANGALALIPIDPSCLYSLTLSRCMLTMLTTSEACATTPKVGQAHQQRTSATIRSMWFRPGACSMHSLCAPPLSSKFPSLIRGSSRYHGTDRRLETGQTQCPTAAGSRR